MAAIRQLSLENNEISSSGMKIISGGASAKWRHQQYLEN
jgi:hypothetical protein